MTLIIPEILSGGSMMPGKRRSGGQFAGGIDHAGRQDADGDTVLFHVFGDVTHDHVQTRALLDL